ncbi:MAG TPA: DUF4031 domain-containing protein [Candidatus Xenobia bacterium]
MLADTIDELHDMADRIGMPRRAFQNRPGGTPHYDITWERRALAVESGAVEIGRRQVVAIIRQYRGLTSSDGSSPSASRSARIPNYGQTTPSPPHHP